MEDWLYILKEWWAQHGRDVKRYGLCLFMLVSGLVDGVFLLAWLGLAAAACMYAYDRYDGAYWQRRGAAVLGQSKDPKPPKP